MIEVPPLVAGCGGHFDQAAVSSDRERVSCLQAGKMS
jgi:hypothetical protein